VKRLSLVRVSPDFVWRMIVEKAASLGGTWRENTYPGAECDIPSSLYSYSFAPNPDWDYKWSKQEQILSYMKKFSADNDLNQYMQFNTKVIGAEFDAKRSIWTLQTDQGEYKCRFLISAIGQLHHPNFPKIAGLENFEGAFWHSAQWNHDIDLQNKNIGVVGCAASAVQLIPEIAKIGQQVTVYQRSPNYVIKKGDRAFTKFEKWWKRKLPIVHNLGRFEAWFLGEKILYPAIQGASLPTWVLHYKSQKFLKKHISDPEMQNLLTPDYPIGAKRILLSDNYYEALARDNVSLVGDRIETITATGIACKDGATRSHDVIIFATGFVTNPFLMDLDIRGRNGKKISDHWRDGAFAYNGVTTADFPNLFFMYGPNTNTGHTSVIVKLESQAGYIVQLIDRARGGEIEVCVENEQAFDKEMQTRLSNSAWAKISTSWYKDGDKITNNWPGNLKEFKTRLKTPDWTHFRVH